MYQWASLAAAVTLLANGAAAQNMLRFACSQLVVDRIDPLVNPGLRYTPHLHQIVGGNSFNLTMTPVDYDLAKRSSCTSCSFNQDKSNYWTAVMFFKAKNGTYHRVPQVGNGGPQGRLENKGGLDVYYIPSGKVTAFKAVCINPGSRCSAIGTSADLSFLSLGLPHACWQRGQHRRQPSFQGQHLPPLLDVDKRQQLCRRRSVHWLRYRWHSPGY
jgi:hypothetical protein